MLQKSNDPSWINDFLVVAVSAALILVLVSAYKGWREDQALRYPGENGDSRVIADITMKLSGIPHKEHCLTCHPRGRRPILSGNSERIPEHPDIIPHSIYELGCMGCHLGEGMARDLVISHGVSSNGARRLLAGEDLQASCYRCHELKPLRGAEKAWQGFQLFSANACDTCHNLDGLAGGRYGPDLSGIGSSLGLKEIQAAIDDPKAEPENSIMPKFSLSPGQIQMIAYFLKSRTRESFHETPMAKGTRLKKQERAREKEVRDLPDSGRDLLGQKKCLACHKFQEADSQIAPDLTWLAYMRGKKYIRDFLHNPRKEIPGAIMPWVQLSQQEEKSILRVLQEKGRRDHLEGNPKHLYMKLCQRCHAGQGDGFGIIQPNLANFPRPFRKNAEFFRWIPDERIVKSIREGVPGTSMPPYGELLGKEAVNSLVDLLFNEFIRIPRAEKRTDLKVISRPELMRSEEEARKVYRTHCASCHGIAGHGKGPEYLKYLPRPKDLTNRAYFHSLDDERIASSIFYGVPGTGMGPFGSKISSQSVWSLVSLIRKLSAGKEGDGESDD